MIKDKLQYGHAIEFGCWAGEAIGWTPLDVRDSRALLITCKAIECRQFNPNSAWGSAWESSALKHWLEDTFLEQAFSAEERMSIEGSPFCLSVEEVQTYFHGNASRLCSTTSHAAQQGSFGINEYCNWWLRTQANHGEGAARLTYLGWDARDYEPGSDPFVVFVDNKGIIDEYGSPVDSSYGVRPALWVRR